MFFASFAVNSFAAQDAEVLRRRTPIFPIHPLPNKIRAREDAEITILSGKQIGEPSRVQFLQVQEI
jgi:hypothetical protein